MNFTDAVRMSMRKYLDGKMDMKAMKSVVEGELMYTPDYFDGLEEMMQEDAKSKKGKKKKDMSNEA